MALAALDGVIANVRDRFDSPTQTENHFAQIAKQLARIEGKLNFGLSILIVLALLNLIKLYWPA